MGGRGCCRDKQNFHGREVPMRGQQVTFGEEAVCFKQLHVCATKCPLLDY